MTKENKPLRSQRTRNFKNKLFFLVFLVLSVTIFFINNSMLFASEEGAHGGGHGQWIWPFINFAILVVILVVFLKKPLQAFFNNRTETIEKTLKEAQEAKDIAEEALKDVEQKLKLKDEEIKRIIASAKKSGREEREKLIEEGRVMSKKIMEQAEGNIAYELKKAKEEIKAEAVEIAMELAEKKLRDKLTAEQQQKLLEEAVSKLEAVK